jgi:hypothetical protein
MGGTIRCSIGFVTFNAKSDWIDHEAEAAFLRLGFIFILKDVATYIKF